ANEHIRQDGFEKGKTVDEKVVIPEGRFPRRHDEDEPRLQKIGREQHSGDNRDDQPPAWTRARRSARSAASRYSPAVACSSRTTARARAVSPAASRARPRS